LTVAKEFSHEHGVTVHEGPMADTRGTSWRQDAIELEKINQRVIQNPNQTLPNHLTTIDKTHAHRAKSDEGTVASTEDGLSGTRPQANR
jgi:hypothetical protein